MELPFRFRAEALLLSEGIQQCVFGDEGAVGGFIVTEKSCDGFAVGEYVQSK